MNNVDKDITKLITVLDSLRDQHYTILSINQQDLDKELKNKIDTNLIYSDLPRIKNSSDKVLLGIEDAEFLKLLSQYMKIFDADLRRQSESIQKLHAESNWLREELTNLHQNLRKSIERVVELEEENKELKFKLELKTLFGDSCDRDIIDDKDISMKVDNFISQGNCDDGEEENKESPIYENAGNNSVSASFELPPRLKTLHNLVVQYAAQGRYEVAIPLCKQTLEDLERTSGRNHPDVATMLNILALVYRDQNKFGDSINLLKEALSIREATLGPVHVSVAANLNNLAVLYGRQKKFHEAEPLCKRSLLIREQLLGPNHPDVAKQLNNLALLCQNQGKYDEVEDYYHKAIKIYSDVSGSSCSDVCKTKNNLASAYMKQSKFLEAEKTYKDIIDMTHKRMFGENSADNKSIWVIAEEKQDGRVSKQNSGNEYLTKILEMDWSACHNTLKNLASLYRRQNKPIAADMVDDLANKHSSKSIETIQYESQPQPSRRPLLRNQGGTRDRPSSVCIDQDRIRNRPSSVFMNQETWTIERTNQMKANLFVKPNNFNKPIGPVKASRTSLADKFTSKFTNNSSQGNGALQITTGDSWQSSGDGRMKKASSMSILPGSVQNNTCRNGPTNQIPLGQSWLSQGRAGSIENLKKAFGKRASSDQ